MDTVFRMDGRPKGSVLEQMLFSLLMKAAGIVLYESRLSSGEVQGLKNGRKPKENWKENGQKALENPEFASRLTTDTD